MILYYLITLHREFFSLGILPAYDGNIRSFGTGSAGIEYNLGEIFVTWHGRGRLLRAGPNASQNLVVGGRPCRRRARSVKCDAGQGLEAALKRAWGTDMAAQG